MKNVPISLDWYKKAGILNRNVAKIACIVRLTAVEGELRACLLPAPSIALTFCACSRTQLRHWCL